MRHILFRWVGIARPPQPGSTESNSVPATVSVRRKRFFYAVAASTGSKVIALCVQLLAFPFALHSLGTDRYAGFLALQSFLSWTGLCGFGVSLSLPKFIAAANITGDRNEERNLVLTALILLGGASAAIFVLLSLLGSFVSPSAMIAATTVPSVEFREAYFVAIAISSAQLFTSIEASLRVGYQELHRSSICALIASLVFVLPGLFYVGMHNVSISTFILVMYLPLVGLFLIDLILLLLHRSYLYKGAGFRFRETASRIAAPSGNALAFQMEYALILYLPTLIVAHMTSAGETAAFGSVLQLLVLGAASLNLIFQPLMSAIANAHSHADAGWIRRNYKRVSWLIVAIGLAVFGIAATAGTFLIRHWLGASIVLPNGMVALFGVYFLFLSVSLLQFYMLSAMGSLRGTGHLYLLQGILALGLGTLLCAIWGTTGMVLGLTLGTASTCWLLPRQVLRAIRNLDG